MESRESLNHDNTIYLLILLFSIIFIIILLFYFFVILDYIRRNFRYKKLSVFWIDYLTIEVFAIIFIGLYIINLIIEGKRRKGNPNILSSDFFPITVNVFLISLFYAIINILLFDAISSLLLSFKINYICKIKESEIDSLSSKLKAIGIIDILKPSNHFIYLVIINIFDLGLIILYILAYVDTDIVRTKGFFNINSYYVYLLRNYQLIVLFLLISGIFFLNFYKTKILNCNYYNPDYFGQKIFEVFSNQAVYSFELLSFRIIVDLFVGIPLFLFLFLNMLNEITIFFSEFFLFIYLIFGGRLCLSIDENNKANKESRVIKSWFCSKKLMFLFSEKNIGVIFNDFKYKFDEKEENIIKELKMKIFNHTETEIEDEPNLISLSLLSEDKVFISSKKLLNYENINSISNNISSNNRNLSNEIKNNIKNKIDFTNICEYYIFYKLLELYFKENLNTYNNIFKKMNQDGNVFKKYLVDTYPIIKRRKSSLNISNTINNSNMNKNLKHDYIMNIERMSRISLLDSKNILTSLKYKQEDILVSLEEKDIFEEFKYKYNIKNQELEFKIESLWAESFFEIFPFYQMKMQEIIKSLGPSYNTKLFSIFIKKISPYKNKLEQNIFYTHDSSLILEVYEKSEFIGYEELKKFVYSYKNYLINTIKNLNYTFLPLIIGIFNIEIGTTSTIVVLYKNPLNFTYYTHFNNWIKFFISEGPEKLRASAMMDDVLDINEIEIKNSLKINEADYEEVQQNLRRDLELLKEINLKIFPVIRLFVGDENGSIKDNNNNNLGFNKNYKATNINEPSILDEEQSHFQNQNFSELLNLSDTENATFYRKQSGSFNEFTSLLEREYYSMSGNDIHTIKIYFTNFFRSSCELNRRRREIINNGEGGISNFYHKFVEEQIFNYITKTSLFEEGENNDIYNNYDKENNNDKLIDKK